MAHYRYYIVNDWIKMLDVRIQNKSPPIIQLGFIRFWREPQPLFFVNIPSIILRPDKYNSLVTKEITLFFLGGIKRVTCVDSIKNCCFLFFLGDVQGVSVLIHRASFDDRPPTTKQRRRRKKKVESHKNAQQSTESRFDSIK